MTIGYIKLHRQLLEWEWYDDINCCRLFIHLLLKVNYESKSWHGIIINSGQLVISLGKLAKQTGLSVQQVRTSLIKLKSTNELTYESTNNYTLITIVKWKDYQDDNRANNKRITNEQQTDNKRITTTKEGKEYKNIIYPEFLPIDLFNDFLEMRKKIKKPATDNAIKLLIGKIEKYHEQGMNITAIIQNSLVNNWQDLFPEKEQSKKKAYNPWKN